MINYDDEINFFKAMTKTRDTFFKILTDQLLNVASFLLVSLKI